MNFKKLKTVFLVAIIGVLLTSCGSEKKSTKGNFKKETYYVSNEGLVVKVTYSKNKARLVYDFKELELQTIQSASGSFYETKNKEWLLANKGEEIFIKHKGVIIYKGKEEMRIGSHWVYLGKIVDSKFIKPVKNTYLDLHFNNEGDFSGSGGCNNYFGKFKEDKNTFNITLEEIGSTMAMCVDDVMKQEDVYLSLLKQVVKKELKENKLHLYFSENDYLVFRDISDQFKPM